MKFSDLEFKGRPGHPMGGQALAFFPNGYGASVIRGENSYGGREGLYELAVLCGDAANWNLTYDTPVTDDVLGWLTEGDVSRVLSEIAALEAAQ